MGKRSQGKVRWGTRVRTPHEKPAPVVPFVGKVYVLDCADCGKQWHCETKQEAYQRAKDHFVDRPRHDTFLTVHSFDGSGIVEVDDADLWEDVATWGPSVGLEVVPKEKVDTEYTRV